MRIKTMFLSGFFAIMLISFVGCSVFAMYKWKSVPVNAVVENEKFEVHLLSNCKNGSAMYGGCKGFILEIVNKMDKNIEVNWNKIFYISGGQTSGGFMFEGIVYKDRNDPKSPDIVFGNSTFRKTIWPNNLVDFTSGKYGGWRHDSMPVGENGAYISLIIDGKEVNERLFVRLSKTRSR